MKKDNPYGDDAGTRVGKPDSPKRENIAGARGAGNSGAGKESTGGVPKHGNPGSSGSPSPSRPLKDEGPDNGSGYGGNKGSPKTSRDER